MTISVFPVSEYLQNTCLNQPILPGRKAEWVRLPASRFGHMPAIPEKSIDGSAKIVYTSKDGKTEQTFDAIDWLARLVVHIPNKYEQLVRHIGYCSNKSRARRKKAETDDIIPSIAPGELTSKQFLRRD
jgi:hypothetical protein